MTFKFMLAAKVDLTKIQYPVLVSAKYDGVRAGVQNGVLVSRAQKPILNKFTQMLFGRKELEGLDGELVVGSPVARDAAGNSTVFNTTTGALRRADGEPQVTFYVFDRFAAALAAIYDARRRVLDAGLLQGFHVRYKQLQKDLPKLTRPLARWPHYANPNQLVPCLQLVEHVAVENVTQLGLQEEVYVCEGFEGLMGRSPYGPYKQGRATMREGWLWKLKRFEDAEAVVIGAEEQMHNANLHTLTRAGKAVRSTHKMGMQATGLLGALIVRGLNGPFKGVEFNVGTGFTLEQRRSIWKDIKDTPADTCQCGSAIEDHLFGDGHSPTPYAPEIIGERITYKYQPCGSMAKPRVPVFKGFRDKGE